MSRCAPAWLTSSAEGRDARGRGPAELRMLQREVITKPGSVVGADVLSVARFRFR